MATESRVATMSALPRDGLYSTLWRTPPIRGQAILGLFAQLTQGAGPISLVLVTRASTGSLAIAGAVTAAMWIAVAVARPLQGRLIDTRGSRLVMLVCGPVHAAALIGLVVAAQARSGAWALVLLSIVAGLALPPVSAAMRVEWAPRLPASERTAAYSLVYLTQEIALLTGPLIVAALIALDSAGLALSVAAAITGAACIAFGVMSGGGGRSEEPRVQVRRRPSAAMPALLGATFLVGAILGALQVATPALALSRGAPALAGVLIATLSVGGITGALVYGGRRWTSDPAVRLLSLLCVIGIGATLLAIGPPLPVVGVGLALVGARPQPGVHHRLAAHRPAQRTARGRGLRLDVDRCREWHRTRERHRGRARSGRGCPLGIPRSRCRRVRRGDHRGSRARPPRHSPRRSENELHPVTALVLSSGMTRETEHTVDLDADRAIMAFIRASRNAPSLKRVGPFALLISATTKLRFLNYAIPDDGADPSPGRD